MSSSWRWAFEFADESAGYKTMLRIKESDIIC
jgi:hypothetical protein